MQFINLHIINKNSQFGGVEKLVSRIIDSTHNAENVKHKLFKIAPTKPFEIIFSKKKLRQFVIIISFFRLLVRYFGIFIQYRSRASLIFHTSEAHLLVWLLLKFGLFRNNRKVFIYFHQSPHLYPEKILPYALALCKNSALNFIVYSKLVLKGWNINSHASINVIHAAPAKPRNNLTHMLDFPFFLFVGRDVDWKRLDLAFDLHQEISKVEPLVKLVVIGGDSRSLGKKWSSSYDLSSTIFLGSQPSPPYKGALFTYIPNDYEKSLETVGLSGLESISFRTPIVIRDGATSDYVGLPGLYRESIIRNMCVSSNLENSLIQNFKKLKLGNNDLRIWRKELSFTRYLRDLDRVVNFFE